MRHRRPRGNARSSPGSSAARVFSAARLTMRREVTSAICSISTSPFALQRRSRSAPDRRCWRQSPMLGASSIAPLQLDAFRLDAARGEMAARDLRILGGDAHMAPAPGIVVPDILLGRGDDHAADADVEVERHVDLGIVEFHQHVVAGDAEMRRAEGDEGRDIEIAHADHVEVGHGWCGSGAGAIGDRRRPPRWRCRCGR